MDSLEDSKKRKINEEIDLLPVISDYECIKKPWYEIFMGFAEILLNRSCCLKYKTATIITKGNQIVSIGYNGTFSGSIECCNFWYDVWKEHHSQVPFNNWIKTEEFRRMHSNWSKKNELHAEMNALNYINKDNVDDNYILYTILSPCDNCAKTIISYGIKTIYYRIVYHRGIDALTLLISNGIKCIHI
jgi:dCMP deaminase